MEPKKGKKKEIIKVTEVAEVTQVVDVEKQQELIELIQLVESINSREEVLIVEPKYWSIDFEGMTIDYYKNSANRNTLLNVFKDDKNITNEINYDVFSRVISKLAGVK